MLLNFLRLTQSVSRINHLKIFSLRCCLRPASGFNKQDDLSALVDCRQGSKIGAIFTKGEMETRLKKLREEMVTKEVDACVFTSHHNVCYYGDVLYCYFGRPFGLVVTKEGQTTISPKVDYGQPWRKTYGDNITYTDWNKDNYFVAVKVLVGENKRIGLEFDHVNLFSMDKYKCALPDVTFIDMGLPCMELKMIKSKEEIALLKNGARICDIGGAAAVEALHENVPEHEVAMASTQAMIREIAATYPEADIMDTWTWLQSGINADGAHNPVTTRRIQKGDIISMNCFPMINGYFSAMERTLFLDHATDREIEIWKTNNKVYRRGLEILQPGKKCSEIALELNEIYKQHNLFQYKTIGYGHSMGILCHYYGRESGLELREDIETVLQPNMVMSMEPMLTIPEGVNGAGGYRENDVLVITADGAENITKFPMGPEYNIIRK